MTSYTSDGVEIVPGLRVFTYDYKWETVLGEGYTEPERQRYDTREVKPPTVWWKTTGGSFDGSRMTTREPRRMS